MSGYYYPPDPPDEEEHDFSHAFIPTTTQQQLPFSTFAEQPLQMPPQQHDYFAGPQTFYQQPQQYQQPLQPLLSQHQPWAPPPLPSNYEFPQPNAMAFPQYVDPMAYGQEVGMAGPSTGYLSPDEASRQRVSRSGSFASNVSSSRSYSMSDVSRSVSPNAGEMAKWGFKNENGSWSCAYPGCSSRSTFNRGCDLRKHYKRHTKSLFCRHDGCPQATEGGFSSKKDRARHEAKHNPNILCEWEGCDRLFSRVDNMKDHVRRVHRRKLTVS